MSTPNLKKKKIQFWKNFSIGIIYNLKNILQIGESYSQLVWNPKYSTFKIDSKKLRKMIGFKIRNELIFEILNLLREWRNSGKTRIYCQKNCFYDSCGETFLDWILSNEKKWEKWNDGSHFSQKAKKLRGRLYATWTTLFPTKQWDLIIWRPKEPYLVTYVCDIAKENTNEKKKDRVPFTPYPIILSNYSSSQRPAHDN